MLSLLDMTNYLNEESYHYWSALVRLLIPVVLFK